MVHSSVQMSLFVQRRNEKNVHVVMKDHVVMIGLVVIQVPMTVEITEEDVTLRKMIGSVQLATMSTSLGELNATVVEKRRKGTSRRTNPQDGTTTVQISDVNDHVKKPMGKTIGNALPATTSTSRSEQNAIAVENRSQVVEAVIVHVEGVILTDVEDSVEIEMKAGVLAEIVEVVILTVGVEAEVVVMSDVIQDEVVQIGRTIVQTSAIEKQEGSVQDMHTIEDHNQYVHAAIREKIGMIEVNM